MILMIDNYDSFTYNLVQLFEARGQEVQVVQNDKISVETINQLKPEAIILSPGPCTPGEAGICLQVVKELGTTYPILGVCLGHQVIGEALGGNVVGAENIIHGKLEQIHHSSSGLFKNIDKDFKATRYHSLVIEKESLPKELEVTATAKSDQAIMAVAHKRYPIFGLQFHPESFGTEFGETMAVNFIQVMRKHKEA